jgi:hypothetical protein
MALSKRQPVHAGAGEAEISARRPLAAHLYVLRAAILGLRRGDPLRQTYIRLWWVGLGPERHRQHRHHSIDARFRGCSG